MTARDGLDRRLEAWFEADAAHREPEHLLAQVLAQTARTRHRPAWSVPERWIPMSTITTRTAEVPRVPWRLVGMAALLVLALAIGAVLIVGASPLGPSLPGSLIGTWKSDVSGGYITFRDDGTFLATLSREGTGEFESGTWAVEGSVLTMTPTSSKYCAGIVGSYELKVVDDGNRLQPSVVDDACQPRLEAWESGLKRIVASEP